MNHKLATIIGGLSLLIPASMGLLITGYPTILHPFPAITVLPALFLASLRLWMAGATMPVVIFFLWNPRLSQGETRVPKRSYYSWLSQRSLASSGLSLDGSLGCNTKDPRTPTGYVR